MNSNDQFKQNRVLVVGGGIGGIRTALDLAEAGRDVVLIDRGYAIGGLMTQLDRTFPTNNCDLCTVSPHLSESGRALHIDLLPMTSLEEKKGEAGEFRVTLKTAPRFIDLGKCTACGACRESFPEAVRFTPGLDPRAPTCMRYPQATPFAYSIDMEKVTDMDALVAVCPANAILPDDAEKTSEIEVGAIVLAVGADLFNYKVLDNFGGGQYPNVVSGLEYERILSASGPTGGQLVRPSDGGRPKKIAWIQCVGSRGINEPNVSYCSSVCCMYALKEAIVTKERFREDIETDIFYMDMRTFGKDYELYQQRAVHDHGIRLIRSRPHSVVEDAATHNLTIRYMADDQPGHINEEYDMVVLSTGFRTSEETLDLTRKLGIELNRHGFAQTSSFEPVQTSQEGIFVCGLFESPKDIPETIVQASAAACSAGGMLSEIQKEMDGDDSYPPERDITGEEARIGIFVCDCGYNIGGVVDVDAIVAHSQKLSHVVVCERVGHGCSRESMNRMESLIKEHQINRVVIGGCSPRTHETKFQDMLRRCGLNKYLVEIANIRDQGTWVHSGDPQQAFVKACHLIQMAASGILRNHPLVEHTLPVNRDVLVIGGGVAGMNASLSLANQGFKVQLIERNRELGGLARKVHKTLEGEDVQAYVDQLVEKVSSHPLIQASTQSLIVDHSGRPGAFRTGIQFGPRMHYREIKHGATILATGAAANRPQEYLLGENDAVVTQLDMDALIEQDPGKVKALNTVIMIQCVGSRVEENPNCSRVCCQAAVKNALRIKQLNPQAQIFILYRDMRTYGFSEDYYLEARRKGVIFGTYDITRKPEVKPGQQAGQVEVSFDDPIIGRRMEITADCLVLSTGLVSDDENVEELSVIFKLPRTSDGYYLEDHTKLRPLDLPVRGFFVAGTAHSPKTIRESIAQAQAAAGRAQTMLAREQVSVGAAVAKVDGQKCAACLVCVRACPYDVPFINADGYSEIDPARCQGCGTCVADCPAKAIQLMRFEDDQILSKLEGLFERMAIDAEV